jgi:hypothetical protein
MMTSSISSERIRSYLSKCKPAVSGDHGHDALFKACLALVWGFGLGKRDAWPYIVEYNSRCEPPWSDWELDRKLDEVTKDPATKNITKLPRGYLSDDAYPPSNVTFPVPRKAPELTPEQVFRNAERFLGGFRIDEADLYHASTIYPGEDWREDSILIFEHLYCPEEFVCICTDYEIGEKKDGFKKAVPKGAGTTRTAAAWVSHIREFGTRESEAGSWVRLNPVKERGAGKCGAHTDADVTAWRFMLVESDKLPIDLQISLYAALALPIACLCTSGGKSAHAWLRLNSTNEDEFRADVNFVLSRLARFGVDPANKNPSRYGRLPGSFRSIGAQSALRDDDTGQQRLLYLNPAPEERPIFS